MSRSFTSMFMILVIRYVSDARTRIQYYLLVVIKTVISNNINQNMNNTNNNKRQNIKNKNNNRPTYTLQKL